MIGYQYMEIYSQADGHTVRTSSVMADVSLKTVAPMNVESTLP